MKKNFYNISFSYFVVVSPFLFLFSENIKEYNLFYYLPSIIFITYLFIFGFLIILILNRIFNKVNVLNLLFALSIFWFLNFFFETFASSLDLSKFIKIVLALLIIGLSFACYYKNSIFKKFILIFSILYFLSTFISNFDFSTLKHQIKKIDILSTTIKPNIYMIVLDSHSSIDFYKREFLFDHLELKKTLNKNGLTEIKDAKSNYLKTSIFFTAFMQQRILDLSKESTDYDSNKPKIINEDLWPYQKFEIHKNLLIKKLYQNNYKFYYKDIKFLQCKPNIYIKCLSRNITFFPYYEIINRGFFTSLHNRYIDYIKLIQSYVNNLHYTKSKINFDYNKKINDLELIVFNNFLLQNKNILKNDNYFFLIHNLAPHYPFRSENCKMDRAENFVSYRRNANKFKEAHIKNLICVNNELNKTLTSINKFDKNNIIIVTGDHGTWIDGKMYNRRTYEILTAIKFNNRCNKILLEKKNNIGVSKFISNCIDQYQ